MSYSISVSCGWRGGAVEGCLAGFDAVGEWEGGGGGGFALFYFFEADGFGDDVGEELEVVTGGYCLGCNSRQ